MLKQKKCKISTNLHLNIRPGLVKIVFKRVKCKLTRFVHVFKSGPIYSTKSNDPTPISSPDIIKRNISDTHLLLDLESRPAFIETGVLVSTVIIVGKHVDDLSI